MRLAQDKRTLGVCGGQEDWWSQAEVAGLIDSRLYAGQKCQTAIATAASTSISQPAAGQSSLVGWASIGCACGKVVQQLGEPVSLLAVYRDVYIYSGEALILVLQRSKAMLGAQGKSSAKAPARPRTREAG